MPNDVSQYVHLFSLLGDLSIIGYDDQVTECNGVVSNPLCEP